MKKNYLFHVCVLLMLLANSKQSKAAVYYLKAGGSITNPGDWGTNTAGTTGVLTNFAATNTFDLTANNSNLTLSSSWSITSGSTVNFGDGTTGLSMVFSTTSPFSNTPKLVFQNNCTVTINANVTFNLGAAKTVFNTGSTFVYGTGAATIAAYGSPYYNLRIDAANSLNGANPTVANNLIVNAGLDLANGSIGIGGNAILNSNLTLGGGVLTLTGSISGTGLIIGDNTGGSMVFNGNSNQGTLNFNGGDEILTNLTVGSGTSSGTISLGSNLIIDGGMFTLNSGASLALNSKTLHVGSTGGVDFAGGEIIGDNNAILYVDGTALGISGSLLMNSTSNNIAGLILNSSGNTLQIGNTLNIIDSITVTNGTLDANSNITLKASGTKTARVASIGASGSVTGNMTVESLFPAGTTGWALIGVNGITGQTVANFDGQVPMTCNGCQYGQNALGAWFNSIQSWNEPACDYDTSVTASTAMSPGKGFWVYLGNTSPTGSTAAMPWSFTGPLKQGAFTVPITANISCFSSTISGVTDGSNLLANPYACPISWEKLYNLGSNSSNLSSPSISYWNRTSVSAADYNAASHAGTGGGTDVIPAGEGFFIENGFGSSLAFNESVKTDINTTAMFRPAASQLNLIRLRVTGKYDTDDAVFTLIPNATTGYDKYDTYKKFSSPGYGGNSGTSYSHYTSISTLDKSTGRYLSINGFPPTTYSVAIPVLVKVSTSGSYTINAEDFANYGSCAVIRDKLTNVYHDLKVSPYVFNINDTTSTPRFELIVCESGGGGIVSVKDLYSSTNISIAQVNGVPVVKTVFPQSTDVVISVYNLLGQQLLNDIKVNGSETTTNLSSLNMHGQVVLIKVTAGNQSAVKKLILD